VMIFMRWTKPDLLQQHPTQLTREHKPFAG
jgi:hypothetical protein